MPTGPLIWPEINIREAVESSLARFPSKAIEIGLNHRAPVLPPGLVRMRMWSPRCNGNPVALKNFAGALPPEGGLGRKRPLLVAALLTVAKITKCLSRDEWIKKLSYI